ncbi:glycosyltransferase family 2 protein [Yoonia litorea]|nr:glycosyltransferase family 2 protein [Yoonia litorea]
MVHTEDFFLERWLAHWRRFLPDEHIYVINHGADPQVSALVHGCNEITLPYDALKKSVNQRRWQILSLFTSGLTYGYDWVICNDVDEFIVLDPQISDDLPAYLAEVAARDEVPSAITAFAIEMVHVPELEPAPIVSGEPIIGPRRIYRLNSNYAKPCIVHRPIEFKAGGHGGNHSDIYLDPHLYNFHLRFVDYDYCMGRFKKSLERRLAGKTAEEQAEMRKGQWGWASVDQTFEALSKKHPVSETIDHPDFRRKMLDNRILRPPFTLMGGGRPPDNYRLPERFNGVL